AWLRAGEALERVWLEGTRARYVASPFSQPVEVAMIRAQLRSDLRLSMQPHMVIRVGRAPVTPASRLRHVADVLDDRTAGAHTHPKGETDDNAINDDQGGGPLSADRRAKD